MSGRRKDKHATPDRRWFVQTARDPSLGIEVSTGQAWVGVDQQVGHFSADALFALTPGQYDAAVTDPGTLWPFLSECWHGRHPDRLLFHPGGASPRPARWSGLRTRTIPPRFGGEIWRHLDALGDAADGEAVTLSRAVAADTARVTAGPDGVDRIGIDLVGDRAYPRPNALIAGLSAGADRERARTVLGDPVGPDPAVHALEGHHLRPEYVDGGLVGLTLERRPPAPTPDGPIRSLLLLLGESEDSPAFRTVAGLAGGTGRRWIASLSSPRRMIEFDGGVEVHLEQDRVTQVRILVGPPDPDPRSRPPSAVLPGATSPPSRDDIAAALGAPVAGTADRELFRYAAGDVVVEYADDVPGVIAVRPCGTVVAPRFHRGHTGELALFLDVLGRRGSDPLVERARRLPGVVLRFRGGVVDEVEIGTSGYHTERFAAFVAGMSGRPTRDELRRDLHLGLSPVIGHRDHDDLRDVAQGWIHTHTEDGRTITTITISRDEPQLRNLAD